LDDEPAIASSLGPLAVTFDLQQLHEHVLLPAPQIWITAEEQGVKAASFFWPWYLS